MLTDLKIAHGEILTRYPSWSKQASTINVLTINTLPLLHTSISTDTNISIQSAFNEKEKEYHNLQFIFKSKMGKYAKHVFNFNQELVTHGVTNDWFPSRVSLYM